MVLDASVCFKTGLTFAIDLFLWWSCIDYCECLSIEDASALGTTEHWTICWLGSCRFIWFNIFVCMLLTPIALGRKCLVTIVTEANKGETVSVHEMVWGGVVLEDKNSPPLQLCLMFHRDYTAPAASRHSAQQPIRCNLCLYPAKQHVLNG